MDLNDAIAELQGKGDWFADEFEDFDERLRSPLATILNAAASGQLIPLETCNARVDAMVEAFTARGLPHVAITFEGEGHGFQKAETKRATYRAELGFLGRVFGFVPADGIEPLDVPGLG